MSEAQSQELDLNINNWGVSDLYQLFNLPRNASTEEVADTTDSIIEKQTEGAVKYFLQLARDKIIEAQAESLDDDEFNTNTRQQTMDWFQNQYLQSDNANQSNKVTSRQHKVEIFDDENGHFQMKQTRLGVNQTYQLPYAQGTINPNLKNQVERIVMVDSQYRTNIFPYANQDVNNPSFNTDFTFTLSENLQNVVEMKLDAVNIPKTWYNFDSFYGNVCFLVQNLDPLAGVPRGVGSPGLGRSGSRLVYVKPGNYTTQSLVDCVMKQLQPGWPDGPEPDDPPVMDLVFNYDSDQNKFLFQYFPATYALANPEVGALGSQGNVVTGTNPNNPDAQPPEYLIPVTNMSGGTVFDPSAATFIEANRLLGGDTEVGYKITFFREPGFSTEEEPPILDSGNQPQWDSFGDGYVCQSCSNTSMYANSNFGWSAGWRITPSDEDNSVSLNVYNFFNFPGKESMSIAHAAPQMEPISNLLIVIDDFQKNRLNTGVVSAVQPNQKLAIPEYITYDNIDCSGLETGNATSIFSKTAPRKLTQAQLYTLNTIIENRSQRRNRNAAPTTSDTFCIIPVEASRETRTAYNNIVLYGNQLSNYTRSYFGPVQIERLRARLIDDKGNLVNLNGRDWSFTLIMKQLYQY